VHKKRERKEKEKKKKSAQLLTDIVTDIVLLEV